MYSQPGVRPPLAVSPTGPVDEVSYPSYFHAPPPLGPCPRVHGCTPPASLCLRPVVPVIRVCSPVCVIIQAVLASLPLGAPVAGMKFATSVPRQQILLQAALVRAGLLACNDAEGNVKDSGSR